MQLIRFKHFLEGMIPGVSPGVDNEQVILNHITKVVCVDTPITIIFTSNKRKKTFKNIIGIIDTSKDTKNQKKADFRLVSNNGTEYNISLKSDNADFWQSADSLMGAKARKIVDKLVAKGKIELIFDKATGNYSIEPQVAVKATPEQAAAVMFGDDILPKGAVIKRTFVPEDFVLEGDTLKITCSEIITSLEDVQGTYMEPWFYIRSEQGRNVIPIGYRGLRCLAAYHRRVDTDKILKI